MTLCLHNFTVTAQAKNVQKKTVLLVLVVVVVYQNAKVLFTLNVMERVKTGIGLFKFLKDNMEKRRWVNIISMYWRKEADDNSSPHDESEKYFACEHHFKADKIRVSLGIGQKTLKAGAIPSIFNFKNPRKSSLGNCPRKDVYQLQMNPLARILILRRNLKLITQMIYYQSCTQKQILIVQNCWKRRLTT